jgi:predicted ATPase
MELRSDHRMLHLKSITLREIPESENQFPFNLPLIRSFGQLEFSSPVTFLVGENGTGKSTLLEAIAIAAGSIAVGSQELRRDSTLSAVKKLANYLRLSWQQRTHKGFFLRAEDFFGYARRLAEMQAELDSDLQAVDEEYKGRSRLAADLAKMPYAGELHALRQRYGDGLDTRSHGESFLALFQARMVPNGLYLLDEPEAPLSPLRQLAFLAILKQMVSQNSQFIIATHAPILMAFEDAVILSFDTLPITEVKYDQLEHVKLTRDFLNDPGAFLKHL